MIKTRIRGMAAAQSRLKRMKANFQGKSLYNEVGEQASRSISANFEAGGRPRWKARKRKYSWPILYKTGRMRARTERTALTWIHRGRQHINQIFSPLYGKFHQYKSKNLPIRKFVIFTKAEIERMKNVFRQAFLRRR